MLRSFNIRLKTKKNGARLLTRTVNIFCGDVWFSHGLCIKIFLNTKVSCFVLRLSQPMLTPIEITITYAYILPLFVIILLFYHFLREKFVEFFSSYVCGGNKQ